MDTAESDLKNAMDAAVKSKVIHLIICHATNAYIVLGWLSGNIHHLL